MTGHCTAALNRHVFTTKVSCHIQIDCYESLIDESVMQSFRGDEDNAELIFKHYKSDKKNQSELKNHMSEVFNRNK